MPSSAWRYSSRGMRRDKPKENETLRLRPAARHRALRDGELRASWKLILSTTTDELGGEGGRIE